VLASGGCGGCPVAGVAMDADDEELTVAARAAFASWTALLAAQLEATGVPAERAGPIASIALTAMEGALVMCRVERSSAPLETAAGELMRLLPAG
jgi:enoyl-[acyl-carrier-protein] reductase (NADH)